jgi:hypothetical protein
MKTNFVLFLLLISIQIYGQDRIIFKSTFENKDVKITKIDSNFIYFKESKQSKVCKRTDIIAYVNNYWDNKNDFVLANESDSARYMVTKYGKIRDLLLEKDIKEVFKDFELNDFEELFYKSKVLFASSSDSIFINRGQSIYTVMYIDSFYRRLPGKYIANDDSSLILKSKIHKKKIYYKIPFSQINNYGVETPGRHALRIAYICVYFYTIGLGNYSILTSIKYPYYKKINNKKYKRIVY